MCVCVRCRILTGRILHTENFICKDAKEEVAELSYRQVPVRVGIHPIDCDMPGSPCISEKGESSMRFVSFLNFCLGSYLACLLFNV